MTRAVAASFVCSRLALVVVLVIVSVARHDSPGTLLQQWDARWYLGIAAHGYGWSFDGKPSLAFFPLFPLLIHVASLLGPPPEITAFIISNVAFAGALFYLYLLTEQELGERAARRSVWLMSLLPTAFFTFLPYTEGLFLLCVLGGFYEATRRRHLSSGAWLAAGLLTRSTAVIAIPAVLLLMRPVTKRAVLSFCVLPLSAVISYVYFLSGQGFSLSHWVGAERFWHRALTFPWTGFIASVSWLVRRGHTNLGWAAENFLQLAITVLCLGLTVAAWRRLSSASRVYCVAFWLLALCTPEVLDDYYAPFSSMDRFVLALFPLMVWGSVRSKPTQWKALLTICTFGLVGAAVVHLAGGWVG